MGTFLRFSLRLASGARHPIIFAVRYPKKIEAVGLFLILAAAFFQLRSDSYQRWIATYDTNHIKGDVEFTRQKIMALIECQSKGTCTDYDRDYIRAEGFSFIPLDAPEKLVLWQSLRTVVFAIGSCLVLIGKWLDGGRLKTIAVAEEPQFSRGYRALRGRLTRRRNRRSTPGTAPPS